MSLIDEALKRARMEAAQRAAESEGLPYPVIPRHLGPPRRRPRWLLAVALLVAAVGGIALGRWLASSGPPESGAIAERPAPAVAMAPAAAPPATEPPAAAPGDDDATVTAPGPPLDGAATPPAGAAAPGPVATPDSGRRTPVSPPAPAPRPAAPAATAPPPAAAVPDARSGTATTVNDPDSGVLLVLPEPEPAAAIETGAAGAVQSYVEQLPTAAGGAIELGGIAWSETGPFALLNGRVLGPGAQVEGFTLESIGPQHVVLSGEGRRVRIDLR